MAATGLRLAVQGKLCKAQPYECPETKRAGLGQTLEE